MSTRSYICKLSSDGNAEVIYCHNDGYPSHVGRLLHFFYNHPESVNNLIKEGYISSLGQTLEESTFFHRDKMADWSEVSPMNIPADEFNEFLKEELLGHAHTIEYIYVYKEADYKWYCLTASKYGDQIEETELGELV